MDVIVRLGEWDFNSTAEVPGSKDHYVYQTFIHSSFNPNTLEHDLALLLLSQPAETDMSNICIICRPGQGDLTGRVCQAGGWGKLGQSKKLRKTDT